MSDRDTFIADVAVRIHKLENSAKELASALEPIAVRVEKLSDNIEGLQQHNVHQHRQISELENQKNNLLDASEAAEHYQNHLDRVSDAVFGSLAERGDEDYVTSKLDDLEDSMEALSRRVEALEKAGVLVLKHSSPSHLNLSRGMILVALIALGFVYFFGHTH